MRFLNTAMEVKNKRGAKPGNKNAAGNKGGSGAPVKYKNEFDKQAYRLCLLGSTDKQLAEFFEVSVRLINDWKKQHLSFLHSLKAGKSIANAEVAEKLFKRATGYSHPDVDIKVIRGKIKKTKLTKFYPPDTTAAIFWLKNRDKENWRDKHDIAIDFDSLSDDQLDEVIDRLIKKSASMKG
jgi:hypothetical protein